MNRMSERERFYRREAMFEGGTAGRWIRLGRPELAGISAAKAYRFARIALKWARENGSLSNPYSRLSDRDLEGALFRAGHVLNPTEQAKRRLELLKAEQRNREAGTTPGQRRDA